MLGSATYGLLGSLAFVLLTVLCRDQPARSSGGALWQIQSQADCAGMRRVDARIPLSQMFGYAPDLRSCTSTNSEESEGCHRGQSAQAGRVLEDSHSEE